MRLRESTSGTTNFVDLTGGVYKKRERIHRSIADLRLLPTPLHVGEFQPTIRTEVGFIRISSRLLFRDPLSRPLRHVCGPGCKRHADLTSSPPSSPLKKQGSPVWIFNIQQGLRSLRYLNRRLTTRTDDSHAAAVAPSLRIFLRFRKNKTALFQTQVRSIVLFRIKPHGTLVVHFPVNSFEF